MNAHGSGRLILTAAVVAAAICLFALLIPTFADSAVQPTSAIAYTIDTIPNVHLSDKTQYVTDPDGLLKPDDVQAINTMAARLEQSLGVQLAVVAVRSIGDNEARMFATDLFKHWGLGVKGQDNGLLIQLVTDPPNRSVVFETGYGLEGVLPDAICYRLQQRYMIPDLRNGNYSEGMLKGVAAVSQYLAANDTQRSAMATLPQEQTDDSVVSSLFWIFGILLLLFLFRRNPVMAGALLGSLFGGRRGGGGGFGGGGFGGGSWGGGSSGGGGSMSRF